MRRKHDNFVQDKKKYIYMINYQKKNARHENAPRKCKEKNV